VRRLIHSALRRFGVDFVRFDAARFPELRRAQFLEDRGVDLLLDVGANDGAFAKELRAVGYRGRIVSFEPQAATFGVLQRSAAEDPLWETVNSAVGFEDGFAELNVAANSSSSSLLAMCERHVASAPDSSYLEVQKVTITRLDSLGPDLLRPAEQTFLKIDVQGFELEVLRGARRTLDCVVGIDCELSFVPLYREAPLFQEVVDFLSERGFGLLALEPVFLDPKNGVLLQVNGLFGRV
jgi:FkbM family methyltransferase